MTLLCFGSMIKEGDIVLLRWYDWLSVSCGFRARGRCESQGLNKTSTLPIIMSCKCWFSLEAASQTTSSSFSTSLSVIYREKDKSMITSSNSSIDCEHLYQIPKHLHIKQTNTYSMTYTLNCKSWA